MTRRINLIVPQKLVKTCRNTPAKQSYAVLIRGSYSLLGLYTPSVKKKNHLFFRATLAKTHRIKMNHIWTEIR